MQIRLFQTKMLCGPLQSTSVAHRCAISYRFYRTMVTFNSCIDTHQISTSPNSHRYLILLVPFWKMMSFKTNKSRFLVQIRAAFCLVCVLAQKQCDKMTRHYHSTTARYGLRNDLTFSLNINTGYNAFSLSGFCFYPMVQKGNVTKFLFQ